jgi:Fe-S oxidoreductase
MVLNIRTMADYLAKGEMPEYLFWVGCAGSFDDRQKKVTRAFCEILQKAEISYAVLGTEESCMEIQPEEQEMSFCFKCRQ